MRDWRLGRLSLRGQVNKLWAKSTKSNQWALRSNTSLVMPGAELFQYVNFVKYHGLCSGKNGHTPTLIVLIPGKSWVKDTLVRICQWQHSLWFELVLLVMVGQYHVKSHPGSSHGNYSAAGQRTRLSQYFLNSLSYQSRLQFTTWPWSTGITCLEHSNLFN